MWLMDGMWFSWLRLLPGRGKETSGNVSPPLCYRPPIGSVKMGSVAYRAK